MIEFGKPATSLINSLDDFDNKSVVLKGVKGEEKLADSLRAVNVPVTVYWSLRMPDEIGWSVEGETADVDCVIDTTDVMFVVDVKSYNPERAYGAYQDDDTNEGHMVIYEPDTGKIIKDDIVLYPTLAKAAARFQKIFPRKNVVAVVVMAPTRGVEPYVVKGSQWATCDAYGFDVPVVLMSNFLMSISGRLDFNDMIEPEMELYLASLVERVDGSNPNIPMVEQSKLIDYTKVKNMKHGDLYFISEKSLRYSRWVPGGTVALHVEKDLKVSTFQSIVSSKCFILEYSVNSGYILHFMTYFTDRFDLDDITQLYSEFEDTYPISEFHIHKYDHLYGDEIKECLKSGMDAAQYYNKFEELEKRMQKESTT